MLALLRADYAQDGAVRDVVDAVVSEFAFLGQAQRTGDDRPRELGVRAAPRGMRWWLSALTGAPDDPERGAPAAPAAVQLRLDDVHEGYGG